MKSVVMFMVAAMVTLAGCNTPVEDKSVNAAPATPHQFAEAKGAASVCGRHAPDWVAASTALKANGFRETENPRFASIQRAQRSVILEKSGTDVIVQLGSRGGDEGACIVGLAGMTPQQSLELAQPWVKKFGALTNAERGQGLSKTAVQAWGSVKEERIVYIAAYKAWDVLDVPGTAARLLYIQR